MILFDVENLRIYPSLADLALRQAYNAGVVVDALVPARGLPAALAREFGALT